MVSYYQNHVGVFGHEPKSRTSSVCKRVKERLGNRMKAKSMCKLSHLKVQTLLVFPATAGLSLSSRNGFSQVTRWQQQSSAPSTSSMVSTIHVAPLTHPLLQHGLGVHPAGLASLALVLCWSHDPGQLSTSQSLKLPLFSISKSVVSVKTTIGKSKLDDTSKHFALYLVHNSLFTRHQTWFWW